MVLGGRSDPDEFSSDILLYQVNCNAWLLPDLTRKSNAPLGGPWGPPAGALALSWNAHSSRVPRAPSDPPAKLLSPLLPKHPQRCLPSFSFPRKVIFCSDYKSNNIHCM